MTLACPDCGALEDLPPLARGTEALCRVCAGNLETTAGRSIAGGFACALATLMLLFPANLGPFMSVHILGVSRGMQLGSGVIALWHGQWVLLAGLIGAFVVVLPFLRFGLLCLALGLLTVGARPASLGRIYRWAMQLDQWAMPDVFLIAAAIGFGRVEARVPVQIGWGGYCFIAAALLAMISRAAIDRRAVWRSIGREPAAPADRPSISCTACDLVAPATDEGLPCPRCGLRLHARKPHSLSVTLALLIAGYLLYAVSMVYPMNVVWRVGERAPYTIFAGIQDLFHAGLIPLGVLIFCTSIAIPLLKLVGLSWFLLSIRLRLYRRLVFRTRLNRLIDEIGRWSNVDPFTVAVIVPLFQFPPLVQSRAGPGSTAFIVVVVLTMVASRFFDPRLMWDAALEARRDG